MPKTKEQLEKEIKAKLALILNSKKPPEQIVKEITKEVEVPRIINVPTPVQNTEVFDKILKELQKDKPNDNEAILKLLNELILQKTVYRSGRGGFSAVRIKNVADEVVNPSTEEKQGDKVSTLNSSTTALDNGENFTGTWEEVDGYSSIKVAVKTDQDGYYEIQFSPDGVNADSTLTRYYRTTQIEPPHKFENMRRYVRIRFFNNSGSNQTYFRLQTMLSNSAAMLNTPIDGTMSQDYDAISTRPTDFKYEVALGRRQGYTTWNKFGYNNDVDTATDPEVVAAFGGAFTPLTTASTLTIVSSSNSDSDTGGVNPQGTGARTLRIVGIDASRNAQVVDVTLDGTTSVATTETWLGINRVIVLTSGTSLSNVGTITITATTGGSTQATLPIGGSVTQQLIFFNYANHVGLADWLQLGAKRFGSGTEPVVTFKGWVYSPLTGTKYEVFREILDTAIESDRILTPSQPFVFTEQDVFWIEVETTRDDTSVTGRFSLITVRDVDA